MCSSCCSSESPGNSGVLRASSAVRRKSVGAVSRQRMQRTGSRAGAHRRCSPLTTCQPVWSSACRPAAPRARGTRASQSATSAPVSGAVAAAQRAALTRLVRVALHRHAEGAAQAEVGNLEDVACLVNQQVLRLQVSARRRRVSAAPGTALREDSRLCITPWRCRWAMPMHSWYMKFWPPCGASACRRARARRSRRTCTVAGGSGLADPRPVRSMNFFKSVSKYSNTCGGAGPPSARRQAARRAATARPAPTHQVKHRLALLLHVLDGQQPGAHAAGAGARGARLGSAGFLARRAALAYAGGSCASVCGPLRAAWEPRSGAAGGRRAQSCRF